MMAASLHLILLLLIFIIKTATLRYIHRPPPPSLSSLHLLRATTPQAQQDDPNDSFTAVDKVLFARSTPQAQQDDPHDSFTAVDKVLFARFAISVATEMGSSAPPPQNYRELMAMINEMTTTRRKEVVHDQAKHMLVRLFPSWLLPAYTVMFARPFPRFSAWMNAWVTHWTTQWLMGPSAVYDLTAPDDGRVVGPQQGLLVEKCRFLEAAGCVQTCLHACKVPTQRFFLEEMGLPVTLRPNMTDLSCRFEVGACVRTYVPWLVGHCLLMQTPLIPLPIVSFFFV